MESDTTHRDDAALAEAGDLVVILSSDLIATVMERYFNDTMFKLPVTVVDLQSSEAGYAFTLAFSDAPTLSSYDQESKAYREANEQWQREHATAPLTVGVTPQRAEMTHEYFEVSEVNPPVPPLYKDKGIHFAPMTEATETEIMGAASMRVKKRSHKRPVDTMVEWSVPGDKV